MNISIYRNISDVDSQSYITFDKIYEILKTPNTIIQPLIENYRKTGDKSIKTYKLPCFVASGEFWYRNSSSLKSYSDVVFLDLDHLDNVNEIKKMVSFIADIQSQIGKKKFEFESMEVDHDMFDAIEEMAAEDVKFALDTEKIHVFDKETELTITN